MQSLNLSWPCLDGLVHHCGQGLLNSQVLCALFEKLFLIRMVDARLYNKFLHPWHVGMIVNTNTNTNPYALRTLLLFVFPMILLALDLRTNPF